MGKDNVYKGAGNAIQNRAPMIPRVPAVKRLDKVKEPPPRKRNRRREER